MKPTSTGAITARAPGTIISRRAARVGCRRSARSPGWTPCALQQAGDLAELAAHLLDHRDRRAPHGRHRERREEEREHRADEEPDHDATSVMSSTIGPSPASRSATLAVSVKPRRAPAPSAPPSRSRSPCRSPRSCCRPRPGRRCARAPRRAGRAISRDPAGVVGDRAVGVDAELIAVVASMPDRGEGDAVESRALS